MAFTITELEALRKKLDRERRELDERERALNKVEEMLREDASGPQQSLAISEPIPQPEGFSDAVRIAVTALGGDEFTVHDVERFLVRHGIPLPKADPRSRIAMALQNLLGKNVITRTFEGKGRAPHRYRIKK